MPRKTFDGIKLGQDIAQMQAADKMSPPSARPSLMDAVRAFATYIETRAKLGWTDPMIAAVLTEAGYAIDAATLRSYRKRMRDEGLMRPLPVHEAKAAAPAEDRPTQRTHDQAATVVSAEPLPDRSVTVAADHVEGATPAAEVTADAAPRAPPPTSATAPTPTPGRTFRVNPTNFPPNRA